MNTETKTAQLELKGDTGEFVVRFATKRDAQGELVIDHDGDVYADGAVDVQPVTVGCYNHGSCEGPAGIGSTFETETDIRAKGKLLMDTQHGRDEFARWKALGAAAEFSYIFRVLDSADGFVGDRPVRQLKRLEVISVDLVARGAGIDTGILSLKSNCGCPGEGQDDWRADVAAEKARFDNMAAREAIRAEKARFEQLTDPYPTVCPETVNARIRAGAAIGLKLAAEKLRVPEPTVRWYRTGLGGKSSRYGYHQLGDPGTVHLLATMPRERVAEVAAHELAHVLGADEAQALEFGAEIARTVAADARLWF